MTISPSTTYYLYSNGFFTTGSILGPAGAVGYYTSSSDANFSGAARNAPNYRLTGDLIPEPTTLTLATLSLLAFAYRRREQH